MKLTEFFKWMAVGIILGFTISMLIGIVLNAIEEKRLNEYCDLLNAIKKRERATSIPDT